MITFFILVWFSHQNVGFYIWSWIKAEGSLKRAEGSRRGQEGRQERASWSTRLCIGQAGALGRFCNILGYLFTWRVPGWSSRYVPNIYNIYNEKLVFTKLIQCHAKIDGRWTGDQEVVGWTPAGLATFFRGDLIMKYFLWSFSLTLIQEGQLSVSGQSMHNAG